MRYPGLILILALSSSAVAQTTADLILINANIRTLDRRTPNAEALAASGGKIIAVGNNSAIKKLAGPQTRVIDAGGRLVIPGFNDAHVHFTAIGNRFSHIDLRGLSIIEIDAKIRHYTSVVPKGRWIFGRLGSHDAKSAEVPTRWTIDGASPAHPLLLYFTDPKVALLNSEALRLADINSKSSDPTDGQIFRRADGEPTGIVTGAVVTRVRSRVPADHARNWGEIAETAGNYAASLGVTSVQDVHSDDLRGVFRDMQRQGRLKTRIYECLGIGDWRKLGSAHVKSADGDAMVRSGCVKGIAPDEEGLDNFVRDVAEIDKAGLQVLIHSIGERANANLLTALEKVARQNGPRDRRFRAEHAYRLKDEDIPRFTATGIIASMQPHLFFNGGGDDGDDFRSMLAAKVKVAFGSDASMTDFNPLFGIYAAVNSGSRSISVEDAVCSYTVGSAHAEFQEQVKGTIAPGMLADFVVLSDDIFNIDPAKIKNVTVVKTVVDGKVVFEGK